MYKYLENNIEQLLLPIIVEDGCNVFPILFKKMDQYLHFIEKNKYLQCYYNIAENIVQKLKEAIEAYLKGNINRANNRIKLILMDTKKLGGKLILSTLNECLFEDEKKQLYKARIGSFYPFRKDEMLHIPYVP